MKVIGITIGISFVFWLLYFCTMHWRNRARAATWEWRKAWYYTLATGAAIPGYPIDIAYNWTIAIVLFLDWPREATLSSRLGRYLMTDTGWRYRAADWICRKLLHPVDPGHCRRAVMQRR